MRLRVTGLLVMSLAMVGAWASPAAAQRFYPPYPYPYGYPYAYQYEPEADVRLDVKPKQAMVYVDGYYAGVVDDFDGVFQRLHVAPGDHEIVVYLQGYRSLHEKLYLGPNTTRKISARLEPLRAGETNEPVPVPMAPPEGAPMPMPRGGPGRYPPPPPPAPPPPDRGPDTGPDNSPGADRSSTNGAVLIRVQPAGADIAIDGEHWTAPARPDERLVVQLSAGHHVIVIRKSGYRDLTTEVDVRPGDTTPVNASLTPER